MTGRKYIFCNTTTYAGKNQIVSDAMRELPDEAEIESVNMTQDGGNLSILIIYRLFEGNLYYEEKEA